MMKAHTAVRRTGIVSGAVAIALLASAGTAPQPALTPPGQPAGQSAVCRIPARFVGLDLERLPLTDRRIALTFDGGGDASGVRSILDTLERRQVRATFFLTGTFVRRFPRLSARIGRLHLVGNHSDTHRDLTRLSTTEIGADLRRAEAAILSATAQDPRRFFRFPYGARDARTIAAVNSRCYVAFRWTVDTLGWKGRREGITTSIVVARVLAAARPGAIVLMHVGANPVDHSTLDADALPVVIRELRHRGYGFARLSAVMSAAP